MAAKFYKTDFLWVHPCDFVSLCVWTKWASVLFSQVKYECQLCPCVHPWTCLAMVCKCKCKQRLSHDHKKVIAFVHKCSLSIPRWRGLSIHSEIKCLCTRVTSHRYCLCQPAHLFLKMPWGFLGVHMIFERLGAKLESFVRQRNTSVRHKNTLILT